MITVHYNSNSWEIDWLTSTTSTALVSKLKNHFVSYGCPDPLVSDNAPQFVLSEVREFANDWNRTSSPGNSKANDKE